MFWAAKNSLFTWQVRCQKSHVAQELETQEAAAQARKSWARFDLEIDFFHRNDKEIQRSYTHTIRLTGSFDWQSNRSNCWILTNFQIVEKDAVNRVWVALGCQAITYGNSGFQTGSSLEESNSIYKKSSAFTTCQLGFLWFCSFQHETVAKNRLIIGRKAL